MHHEELHHRRPSKHLAQHAFLDDDGVARVCGKPSISRSEAFTIRIVAGPFHFIADRNGLEAGEHAGEWPALVLGPIERRRLHRRREAPRSITSAVPMTTERSRVEVART